VLKGYEFYARSGRDDLDPPPPQATIAYYESRAPTALVFPAPREAARPAPVKFNVQTWTPPFGEKMPPAIANLHWMDLGDEPILLACDMRDGLVSEIRLRTEGAPRRTLAQLNNPCRAERCDLDGDGLQDLVVADLGSFLAIDHHRGSVVWLRGTGQEAGYEPIVVGTNLGRVADARPADFDGDGDLDLVVADFGLHETGQIAMLRNIADPGQRPEFQSQRIDPRPGTIHVPVVDLNADGHPDFLALISQEFESIEIFLNQGDGRFRAQVLWTGPDITFGLSGMELADLDQDGDTDILFTNGDAFDNQYVNPSHGIQWLENLGQLQFKYHRLANLIGAFRALPGDMDGDGDLDIVASAWLPPQIKPRSLSKRALPALLLLEQTSPGEFVRHTLEAGSPRYSSLELADFDNDGDLDFAVGTHRIDTGPPHHGLSVWWNQPNERSEAAKAKP
jgi:hypothetical protein